MIYQTQQDVLPNAYLIIIMRNANISKTCSEQQVFLIHVASENQKRKRITLCIVLFQQSSAMEDRNQCSMICLEFDICSIGARYIGTATQHNAVSNHIWILTDTEYTHKHAT